MGHRESNRRPWWRRGIVIAALGALAAFGYVGVRLAQQQFPAAAAGLPDLLGAPARPLPQGALHVQDLAADMKGYQGTILVRGVMAVVSPGDPNLFGMIDSREAKVCQDLKCAKFYLPVKTTGSVPKPWDELDVRGQIVADARMTFLKAESVQNLGPIR